MQLAIKEYSAVKMYLPHLDFFKGLDEIQHETKATHTVCLFIYLNLHIKGCLTSFTHVETL